MAERGPNAKHESSNQTNTGEANKVPESQPVASFRLQKAATAVEVKMAAFPHLMIRLHVCHIASML